MTHVTCKLTAENRDQLRDPTLDNRLWATFTRLTRGQIGGGGAGEKCPVTAADTEHLSGAHSADRGVAELITAAV